MRLFVDILVMFVVIVIMQIIQLQWAVHSWAVFWLYMVGCVHAVIQRIVKEYFARTRSAG